MKNLKLDLRFAFMILSGIGLICMLWLVDENFTGYYANPYKINYGMNNTDTAFWVWVICGGAALVSGIVSAFLKSDPGFEEALMRKFTTAGVFLWLCALALFLYLMSGPSPFEVVTESPDHRINSGLRNLALSIQSYHIDWNCYPAWSLDPTQNANGWIADKAGILRRQPTFRQCNKIAQSSLTTPISYIDEYPPDFLSPVKNTTFCYWNNATTTTPATGYILWSAGPDRVYDLTIDNIAKVYDPKKTVTSNLLLELTFDPTNGSESRGDIWRVKN